MHVLRTAYQFCRPYWLSFGLIFLCLVVERVYGALSPLSFKYLLDDAFLPGNIQIFWLVLSLLIAGGALAFAAALLGERMSALVTERVLYRVRKQMFDRMTRQSLRFYHRFDQGTLMSRATSDLAAVERVVAEIVPSAFGELLALGVGISLMLQLEWKLALLLAVGFALLFFSPNLLRPQARQSSVRYREVHDEYVGTIQEMLTGYRVIKGLNLRDYMMARLEQRFRDLFTAGYRLVFLYALLNRVPMLAFMLLNAGVIAYGGFLIFQEDLTVGAFIAFYTIFLNVGSSVTALSQLIPSLMQAEASFQRIEEILQAPLEQENGGGKMPLHAVNDEIRFDRVRFRYNDHSVALDDVSFAIPAGGLTAFVGPSGSGKSTALQLLMRLYSPEQGTITIDGTDLRQVDEDHFYRMTGVVFQDSFLFHTTIEENIRLPAPNASVKDVYEAAAAAQIHETILRLPAGYQTEIKDFGANLSGGQRQRIAIARALAKKPNLLLLDEITSSLDPSTEAEINALIERLRGERTIVTVTHRLSSVVHADRIVVFQNGKAVETGTHDELLRRNGVYKEMWDKQTGFSLSGDGFTAKVTAERLALLPFFKGIPVQQLEAIARLFVTETYDQGHTLIRANDPGDKFYIIVRGAVAVYKNDALVAVLEDGDHFGEIALLKNIPRTADVVTKSPSILLSLRSDLLRRLASEYPTIRSVLEASLKERFGV